MLPPDRSGVSGIPRTFTRTTNEALAPHSPSWLSPCMLRHMSSQTKFDEAKQRLNTLKEDPGKLQ